MDVSKNRGGKTPQNGWWTQWFQTLWTNGWFGGFPIIFGNTQIDIFLATVQEIGELVGVDQHFLEVESRSNLKGNSHCSKSHGIFIAQKSAKNLWFDRLLLWRNLKRFWQVGIPGLLWLVCPWFWQTFGCFIRLFYSWMNFYHQFDIVNIPSELQKKVGATNRSATPQFARNLVCWLLKESRLLHWSCSNICISYCLLLQYFFQGYFHLIILYVITRSIFFKIISLKCIQSTKRYPKVLAATCFFFRFKMFQVPHLIQPQAFANLRCWLEDA